VVAGGPHTQNRCSQEDVVYSPTRDAILPPSTGLILQPTPDLAPQLDCNASFPHAVSRASRSLIRRLGGIYSGGRLGFHGRRERDRLHGAERVSPQGVAFVERCGWRSP
jgi:hypothetical protein